MITIGYSRRVPEEEYLQKQEFFKQVWIFSIIKTRGRGGKTSKPPVFTREYRLYI